MRIITVTPNEPEDKNYVLNYKPNDPLHRSATATVRDPKGCTTYQVVVNLTKKSIESFTEYKNVQPGLTFDEMVESDDALRTSEALLAAFAKRKINMDDVVFLSIFIWIS